MGKARIFTDFKEIPDDGRPLHLAVGMFDGVHRGHQVVIGSAIQSAHQSRGRSGVLTFWPHPSRLFNPENFVPMISNPLIKTLLLENAGVDWIIQKTFDWSFAQIPANIFPELLIKSIPNVKGIYVGENFRYGKGRQGDVSLLVEIEKSAGIQVVSADRLRFNGEPISSTRIRESLTSGRLEEANLMLGYNYFSLGKVEPGNRKGRELGVPTLNIPWEPECKPAFGVYLVRVFSSGEPREDMDDAEGINGIANYGVRPTLGDRDSPILEIHLLEDDSPWDYGSSLRVEWLKFVRPEKKFDSVEALKKQMGKDLNRAQAYFS